MIGDAEMVYTSVDTAIFLITDGSQEDLDVLHLEMLLYNAMDYSEISLNDGGIREIINTGNLNIISDERIRLILASWDEHIHKIRKFEGDTQYTARRFSEYLFDYFDASRTIRDPSSSIFIPEKRDQLLSDPRLSNFLARVSTFIHKRSNCLTR